MKFKEIDISTVAACERYDFTEDEVTLARVGLIASGSNIIGQVNFLGLHAQNGEGQPGNTRDEAIIVVAGNLAVVKALGDSFGHISGAALDVSFTPAVETVRHGLTALSEGHQALQAQRAKDAS